LDELASAIRNDIKLQDFKTGWFTKHLNCCTGADIIDWITEKFGHFFLFFFGK
jgi:hypothetical protein